MTPILPVGLIKSCAKCLLPIAGRYEDKDQRQNNWKLYCSVRCFRASQTKYVGLTAKQRRQAYDKARWKKVIAQRRAAKRVEGASC